MVDGSIQQSKTLQARIVSGAIVLLSGSGLATALSFAYNIAVARFLGPTGFGNATAIYTLLTLISAVTLSLQIVCAKVVAQQSSEGGAYSAYRVFHRGAWICGGLVAMVLVLFQTSITDYLKLPAPVLIDLLAVGVAFYVPLGSRRGYIQGAYGFRRFAANLVLEGAVRLGGSIALMMAGLGVPGVIAANSAAVAVAYLAAGPKLAAIVPGQLHIPEAFRESLQAAVFFAGQMLINNCDIVLVKHFFAPTPAGLYAVVAMVGRVIFSLSSAVVNSMFPLVAGTNDEERKDLKVIATSLLLVISIGSLLAIGLRIAPAGIWTTFFGARFGIAGKFGMPYLLALYAITTVVYSLSVVIITYEMSYKIANTSWIQLAFSGVLIAGICRYHSSLREVILVQLVLMLVLFIVVAIPFLISSLSGSGDEQLPQSYRTLRTIRPVSEDEVISEFLKSDFQKSVFRDYQKSMKDLVLTPDLNDVADNAKRRALFFLRHLSLWREIPISTEWYEVYIDAEELARIRVFPRAQWRKLGKGNFSIMEIAEQVREQRSGAKDPFPQKIAAIRDRLLEQDGDLGSVILIGVNENGPLTILDGNHRLVAALTAYPPSVQGLRFLCGLSPEMAECCWYNTNMGTLFRYGVNVLRQLLRDPEAELARLLQSPG